MNIRPDFWDANGSVLVINGLALELPTTTSRPRCLLNQFTTASRVPQPPSAVESPTWTGAPCSSLDGLREGTTASVRILIFSLILRKRPKVSTFIEWNTSRPPWLPLAPNMVPSRKNLSSQTRIRSTVYASLSSCKVGWQSLLPTVDEADRYWWVVLESLFSNRRALLLGTFLSKRVENNSFSLRDNFLTIWSQRQNAKIAVLSDLALTSPAHHRCSTPVLVATRSNTVQGC